jgi:PiT family inorganic phosphate transporter
VERGLHFLSAGAVSFARGLNDTPKIAGILLAGSIAGAEASTNVLLGLLMILGGFAGAARVARTMSFEITPMSDRQGFLANLVTSAVVVGASAAGLPVSTTHVTCGAIAGLGFGRGSLARKRFGQILLAWLVTLPLGAMGAAAALWIWGSGRN